MGALTPTPMPKPAKPTQPYVSSIQLPDGRLVELLHDVANDKTSLAIWDGETLSIEDKIPNVRGDLLPYPADHAILRAKVVRFPSDASDYGDTAQLIADIRAYLHGYVDLSDGFELLVAHYVLFTWVHDRFNELPYLRLQGAYGSGKTRFLLVAGSICRTPIFLGGASTTSPMFHMLDEFSGTLLIDEADFRFSDETAQIAKILNNGNVRGFPVLRSEAVNAKEFRPRPFQVFGPKLIAMRGEFSDAALESRFITERSDGRTLRSDIPLNLPARQEAEALELRNKLLMFRLRRFADVGEVSAILDPDLDPRTNQIFAPLLSIMETDEAREALLAAARERQLFAEADRSSSHEAGVLGALLYLMGKTDRTSIALSDIADLYMCAHGREHAHPVTSRWVGRVLRTAFGLHTHKSSGGLYALSSPHPDRLKVLRQRYRITDDDLARYAERDVAEVLTQVLPIDPCEEGSSHD